MDDERWRQSMNVWYAFLVDKKSKSSEKKLEQKSDSIYWLFLSLDRAYIVGIQE